MPVLKAICADAEKICPDAWIINYTNPTQYVADAVRRISNLRILSMCDGFLEDAADLALLVGFSYQATKIGFKEISKAINAMSGKGDSLPYVAEKVVAAPVETAEPDSSFIRGIIRRIRG